jgi:hypothetical protein
MPLPAPVIKIVFMVQRNKKARLAPGLSLLESIRLFANLTEGSQELEEVSCRN